MTKTEEDKMKQWKLVLVALLAVLLVCACTSAMAECTHPDDKLVDGGKTWVRWEKLGEIYHYDVWEAKTICTACNKVFTEEVKTQEAHSYVVTKTVKADCKTKASTTETCSKCGQVKVTEGALGDHDFVNSTVPATCTKGSYALSICKICGLEVKGAENNDAGHKWDNVVTPATCTEGSYTTSTCSVCGTVVVGAKQNDAGHKWQPTVLAPTCTKGGYTYNVCKVCGVEGTEASRWDYKDALGHDYVKGEHVDNTCDKAGYDIYTCSRCGDVQHMNQSLDPAAHSYVKGAVVAPTCTEGGYTNYSCANCDETFKFDLTDATGHKEWIEHKEVKAICGKNGTEAYLECKACGTLRTTAWGPLTAPKTIKMPAAEHDWLVTDKVPATCEKAGKVTYECRICGETKSEATPVLDHCYSDGAWVIVKEPTCHETGIRKNACKICGGHEIVEEIPAVGHQFADPADLKGYTGNVPGVGTVVTPANCEETGTGRVICVVCETVSKDCVIPALGHDWSAWAYGDAATCTTDMIATRTCERSRCDEKEEKVVVEAFGHRWQITAGKDATCTEDGKVDRFCPVCVEEEKNVKVPATGHNLVWITVAQPTAAADGLKELTCTVCGYVAESKVIPYTVMRYSNTATAFGPTTRELVGGSEWARVTPIDLSVEGTFTYPLIASNQYVIGTVTVTIANGTATVNYDVAASQIKVTDEALYLYADKAALAAGTAQEYAFGAPIQIGEDTNVILSVLLTVDYDAVGAGVTGFAADEAQIEAMKAIID